MIISGFPGSCLFSLATILPTSPLSKQTLLLRQRCKRHLGLGVFHHVAACVRIASSDYSRDRTSSLARDTVAHMPCHVACFHLTHSHKLMMETSEHRRMGWHDATVFNYFVSLATEGVQMKAGTCFKRSNINSVFVFIYISYLLQSLA